MTREIATVRSRCRFTRITGKAMKKNTTIKGLAATASFMLCAIAAAATAEPPVQSVLALAKKEKPALLETLKELTAIESGSREPEELDRIANVLAAKLRALGGKVELIEPTEATTHRLSDTPEKIGKMVRATFTGTGTKKIMLMAHMDTVYPRGMLAQQPYRIDGERAYGLGIADNRQGIATILHTLAMLGAMNFRDYGTITVFKHTARCGTRRGDVVRRRRNAAGRSGSSRHQRPRARAAQRAWPRLARGERA
jgi:hypothetical protein